MNDDLSADLVLSVYMDMIKVKAFLFSNWGKRGWERWQRADSFIRKYVIH